MTSLFDPTWKAPQPRLIALTPFLLRSVLIGVIATVAQILVTQLWLIGPNDGMVELVVAGGTRSFGTGLLFAWCARLATEPPKTYTALSEGVVTCVALLMVAFVLAILTSGMFSRNDPLFQSFVMQVTIAPFIYSLLGMRFGMVTGHRFPFGKLLLTALCITIVYVSLQPWLVPLLREIAPGRPDIGNSLVLGLSNVGHLSIVSFMMWLGIKSLDQWGMRF